MKSMTDWHHPRTNVAMSKRGDSSMRITLMKNATGFQAILAGHVAMVNTPEAYDSRAMM